MALPTEPSWFEHVDFMQVCLVGALGYIVWTFQRYINSSDNRFEDLYQKFNGLSNALHELKGEHNARRTTDQKPHC